MDRLLAQIEDIVLRYPELGHPLVLLGLGIGAGILLMMLLGTGPLRRRVRRQETALALAEERASRIEPLLAEREALTRELTETTAEGAALSAQIATEREAHATRIAELRDMQEDMRKSFASLSRDALGQNAESFLTLVSERFEKHKAEASDDLGKRQTRIEAMLKPISDSLTKFETQVGELERHREGAYRAIQQQVATLTEGQSALNSETRKLVQALRAPKTRGNWGEFQLRQVFDMAGMVDHVDFQTEVAMDDGRLRPDAVVALPGGKSIVIDAKTPLDGYLNALETENADDRRAELARHARQVKDQVKLLSQKAYWDSLEATPDFVVMFVPGEAFYAAALEQDPGLFEFAINNKVMIASPTTLIALLKSVAYGWQQEKMAENAIKAVELGRDLYRRVKTFGGHLEKMGRSLDSTVGAYNAAVSSVESRILPAARKFETLSIAPSGEALDELSPLDSDAKRLTAPELRGADA
ncbi:MAG: DNA recombination protein RmuC [Pseudomonadota bacterium]